jgi:hypothetical protein
MPKSDCYLFKNCFEHWPVEDIDKVPKYIRGIYVLFTKGGEQQYSVVYIGMARGEKSGVKSRLRMHRKQKADKWTHFSVFEVWDNITQEQVEELEGLFRHVYRRDPVANKLAIQRSYKPLIRLRRKTEQSLRKKPENGQK